MEESDFCDGSDGGWWPSGLRGMEASVKRGIKAARGVIYARSSTPQIDSMLQIGFQKRRGSRAQGCRDCDYGSGGSWNVPGPGSYATEEVWNSSSIRGIKINQEHLQLVIHVSARVEAFWILPQVCVRMIHVLSLWNRSTSTQSSTQHGNLLTGLL